MDVVCRIEESHVVAAVGIGMDLQPKAEEQRRCAHELELGERMCCVLSDASRVPPAGRVNDWIELERCASLWWPGQVFADIRYDPGSRSTGLMRGIVNVIRFP